MNSTNFLLDKYKATCSLASDNAAAASLGVSRQAISKWRHGENQPEAATVAKLCAATGEPVARWLPRIEAERARTPADRKVWLQLAETAVVALMAGAVLLAHNPATLSIMSNLRDVARRALAWIARTRKEIHACVSAGASMLTNNGCTRRPGLLSQCVR